MAGAVTVAGLYQAVREVATRRPDVVAIRTTDRRSTTYAGLVDLADRVAGGLVARGVRPGDAVAVVLRNSIEYVALILAVARLGARYVPLLPNFDDVGVHAARTRARPVLLVTDRHRPVGTTGRTGEYGPLATVDLDPLTAATPLDPAVPTDPTAVFRLLWTSGSTGFPKMMAWRQDRFVTERRRWLADTGIRDDDVFFCRHTLDVAHATDLHVFAALLTGAELVLADPQAPADVLLDQLVAHQATVTSALPQHYADLIGAARRRGRSPLPALRRPLCGGAYLDPATVRDAADVLGIHIRQIYGSTEFGLALGNMADVLQSDGLMRPVRGVGTRLEPFVPGRPDIGELVLYSDCTSEGYVDAPDANARTFRRPEFWTGDVAIRTTDGGYRILGRVSETLAATDGPLPAPVLDGELSTADAVAAAVCLAVHPGEFRAEVAVAAIAAGGHSDDDVTKAVTEILAARGLTGTVRIVPAIPRTPVGKVDKPMLRTLLGLTGGVR
ncbi:AMP-binding protein [Solwaraspora sp. WMMD406]|uniref:class I adenylate-forming enzyme family protein n=1 Tax=Solwaraspora sp. WMMD406 TaxID=3016095 RepID=UPI002417B8B8|nr:AMP-binding protein [Solwaraspora sp. WMMD406]MDG4765795.1 AMP-binding protein [Solwaraspora sp. WMMD406]